jgi:hypothetical protein
MKPEHWPNREYAMSPFPSTTGWGVDIERLIPKVDQMRELVLKLVGDGEEDGDIVRAAVILLAATIAGQNLSVLQKVTADDTNFISRIKRAALENGIWIAGRGNGSYSKVDITDWWKPRDGDAALILDAMACLGLLMRTRDQDGLVRYISLTAIKPPAPPVKPILISKRKPKAPTPKAAAPAPKPIPKALQVALPEKTEELWWLAKNAEETPLQIEGLDEQSRERQAVLSAFEKARARGDDEDDCYLAAARAWYRLHPDYDRRAAAQRAAIIVMGERWGDMMAAIRHRIEDLSAA